MSREIQGRPWPPIEIIGQHPPHRRERFHDRRMFATSQRASSGSLDRLHNRSQVRHHAGDIMPAETKRRYRSISIRQRTTHPLKSLRSTNTKQAISIGSGTGIKV